MLYSHPEARKFVVDALVSRVKSLHVPPDVIAGTATAAIGWAALVADRIHLPFVYVRSKAKEHGMGKRIEGDLPKGKHVVLIEDLLSTGGSAVSSVEALRTEGESIVTDVVAIFSYELLSAAEAAQEADLQFHPVATLGTLLSVAAEEGRLTADDVRKIGKFSEDPKQWNP